MPVIGRLVIVIALLGAASTVSAQVINGESTYGDSDLHQPPADVVPRADGEDARVPQARRQQEPTRR